MVWWCGLIGGNQAQVSQCSMGGTGPIAASDIPYYRKKQLASYSYPWYASNDSKRRSPSNSATCPSLLYLRWESNRIKQVDQWSNNLLPSPWIGHFHRCPSWFQASPLDVMPKPAGRQVFWGHGKVFFPSKVTQLASTSTTITDMSRAFPRDVASSSPHRNLLTVRLFRFS